MLPFNHTAGTCDVLWHVCFDRRQVLRRPVMRPDQLLTLQYPSSTLATAEFAACCDFEPFQLPLVVESFYTIQMALGKGDPDGIHDVMRATKALDCWRHCGSSRNQQQNCTCWQQVQTCCSEDLVSFGETFRLAYFSLDVLPTLAPNC